MQLTDRELPGNRQSVVLDSEGCGSERHWTQDGIVRAGYKALVEALGPANFIRFLHQFETGDGDYTRERERLVGDASVDEIVERIVARRTIRR